MTRAVTRRDFDDEEDTLVDVALPLIPEPPVRPRVLTRPYLRLPVKLVLTLP